MGFYLIYVDDYGNTGSNLNDPKQPIFLYFAAIVPAESWGIIEQSLLQRKEDLFTLLAQKAGQAPSDPELKATRLLSFKRPYNYLSWGSKADFIRRIALDYSLAGTRFVVSYVDKELLAEAIRSASVFDSARIEALNKIYVPNVLAFANLIGRLDAFLAQEKSRGIIIIDEQDEFEFLPLLGVYADLRRQGLLKGLIERPLRVASHEHVLLQGVDLLAYVYGRYMVKRKLGQKLEPYYERIIQELKSRLEEVETLYLDPSGSAVLSEALKNLLPAGESAEKLTQVSGFIQIGMVLLRIREKLWPRKKQG